MAKASMKAMEREFEQPPLEEESGRSFGLLATVLILTIVGVAIWFIVNQDEAA